MHLVLVALLRNGHYRVSLPTMFGEAVENVGAVSRALV